MNSGCGKCGKSPANPLMLLRGVSCGKCGKSPANPLMLLRAVCGSSAYRYFVSISAPCSGELDGYQRIAASAVRSTRDAPPGRGRVRRRPGAEAMTAADPPQGVGVSDLHRVPHWTASTAPHTAWRIKIRAQHFFKGGMGAPRSQGVAIFRQRRRQAPPISWKICARKETKCRKRSG